MARRQKIERKRQRSLQATIAEARRLNALVQAQITRQEQIKGVFWNVGDAVGEAQAWLEDPDRMAQWIKVTAYVNLILLQRAIERASEKDTPRVMMKGILEWGKKASNLLRTLAASRGMGYGAASSRRRVQPGSEAGEQQSDLAEEPLPGEASAAGEPDADGVE